MGCGEAARREAVRSLYGLGRNAVFGLAEAVAEPDLVGAAVGSILPSFDEFKVILDEARSRGPKLDTFAVALSSRAVSRFGADWREYLRAQYISGALAAEEVVTLALGWNDDPVTWDFMRSLGPTVDLSYWRRKPIWPPAHNAGTEQIETVARNYLGADRPEGAVYTIEFAADRVSGDLILEISTGLLVTSIRRLP